MNHQIRTYKSELGEIELTIESKGYEFDSTEQKNGNVNITTLIFEDGIIKIREFKLPNPIYSGGKIENSIGWSILIESLKDNEDQISFKCQFKDQIKGDISTGEHLDALQFIKNSNYDLHIGTEDAESIMWRANSENYMPKRFFKLLRNKHKDYADKHFTDYCENGFQTKWPKLLAGEVVKFHFLIAESALTNENDVRTWLAVEKRIEEVEQIIEDEKAA
ncbi:hypothetical protein [Lewinella cohaerens]|uniref:hypothetical protein n=1 Tax=Lewinella cohaerens TaxID=70995 RepID=UPI0003764BB5|nr:hypothetical protein [Lewinella cohaerens]